MRKLTKISLAAVTVVGLSFGAGTLAGADSLGIRVTETNSNWQGPNYNDERSVFFERNKEVFDNGYYRYCTAANSNVSDGPYETVDDVDLELDCTPVFSPEGIPVSE